MRTWESLARRRYCFRSELTLDREEDHGGHPGSRCSLRFGLCGVGVRDERKVLYFRAGLTRSPSVIQSNQDEMVGFIRLTGGSEGVG